MAGRAHRAVGVEHARRRARAIVLDHLEFEASQRFVVADHLQHRGALLVADVESILEQRHPRGLRFAVHRYDHTRKAEELRRASTALQRSAERNQHALDAGLAQRIGTHLRFELAQQRSERKRDVIPAIRCEHVIEQRASHLGNHRPRDAGWNRPVVLRRQLVCGCAKPGDQHEHACGQHLASGERRKHAARDQWTGRSMNAANTRTAPHSIDSHVGWVECSETHLSTAGDGFRCRFTHPTFYLPAATTGRCVPTQQSSLTAPVLTNPGPSRSAISLLYSVKLSRNARSAYARPR